MVQICGTSQTPNNTKKAYLWLVCYLPLCAWLPLALTCSFIKTAQNYLIILIWEPMGGELNLCPKALERGRWKDHSATVNNVTVWIMSSLCARASIGLMTETCFRLGLTQTYTHTYVVHDPTHTNPTGGSHGGGPISLDNLLLTAKRALGCVLRQLM